MYDFYKNFIFLSKNIYFSNKEYLLQINICIPFQKI